jgi:hypothetical protein
MTDDERRRRQRPGHAQPGEDVLVTVQPGYPSVVVAITPHDEDGALAGMIVSAFLPTKLPEGDLAPQVPAADKRR